MSGDPLISPPSGHFMRGFRICENVDASEVYWPCRIKLIKVETDGRMYVQKLKGLFFLEPAKKPTKIFGFVTQNIVRKLIFVHIFCGQRCTVFKQSYLATAKSCQNDILTNTRSWVNYKLLQKIYVTNIANFSQIRLEMGTVCMRRGQNSTKKNQHML